MDSLINGLNELQRQAATHNEKDVLQVIAGPGTGKTKVLTARFAYLIAERNIHPLRVIMTTFTRKAANEIKERLKPVLDKVGVSSNGLLIGTFHSICARLLRQYGHLIGLPKNWSISKTEDINTILRSILEELPTEVRQSSKFTTELDENKTNVKFLLHKISDLKAKGTTADLYSHDSNKDFALSYIYKRFQEQMLVESLLDFDDILLYAKELLRKHRVWPFIKHVLVDEYQDTNELQLDLVFLLARGDSSNDCVGITTVGDPDQSIYAFRFASAENFTKLQEQSPVNFHRISLIENYRSAQTILDLSERVIRQQKKDRIARDSLKGQFDNKIKPVFSYFERNDRFDNPECDYVAHEIKYLMTLPNLFKFSDVSVLLRTRRQINDVERSFIKHRIPYRIVNAKGVWEKKESNIFLDYLRILSQDFCSMAILRCLQFSSNGVGSVSIKRIKSEFESHPDEKSVDLLRVLCSSKTFKSQKLKNALTDFISDIDQLKSVCLNCHSYEDLEKVFFDIYVTGKLYTVLKNPEETILEKMETMGFCTFLQEAHPTMHKVFELFTGYKVSFTDELASVEQDVNDTNEITLRSESFNETEIDFSLLATLFTKSISLYSAEQEDGSKDTVTDINTTKERVTVSTIHAAKGLEWSVVFIPSINQGQIPFTDKSARQRLDDLAEMRIGDQTDYVNEDGLSLNSGLPLSTSIEDKEAGILNDIESTLNEERRIFFVALTRAKHLLYLSSSGKKSVFLEDCERLCSNDAMLADKNRVIAFYKNHGLSAPADTPKFSLQSFCNDYAKYKTTNRSSMIWMNQHVQPNTSVDLRNNKSSNFANTPASSFAPASSLLINGISYLPDVRLPRKTKAETLATDLPSDRSISTKRKMKKAKITIDMLSKSSSSVPCITSDHTTTSQSTQTNTIKADTHKHVDNKKVSINKKRSFAPAYTPVRNNAIRMSTNKTALKSTSAFKK